MGTLLRIELETEPSAAPQLFADAWTEIDRVDHEMSGYRADSEIERLSSSTCSPLSTESLEVLEFSQRVCRGTDGAFDITVAPLIVAWGFRGHAPVVPSEEEIAAARGKVGCDRFRLSATESCAWLDEGTHLDLGGVAKGYALDLARKSLVDRGVRRAVLDLGGQLHHIGANHSVVVANPFEPEKGIAILNVSDASVSTSAQTERFIEVEGRRYGHILDPRTGRPASGMLSATVAHPSGMVADTLSTALFVGGPKLVDSVLEEFPDAGILLVREPVGGHEIRSEDVTVHGRLDVQLAELLPAP